MLPTGGVAPLSPGLGFVLVAWRCGPIDVGGLPELFFNQNNSVKWRDSGISR